MECDGTFYTYPETTGVTMVLIKKSNNLECQFKKDNIIIHEETIINYKRPVFKDNSFYLYGKKYFTCETESTSRFKLLQEYFNKNFNVTKKMIRIGNYKYIGEATGNIPNGDGCMYYDDDRMMIRGVFTEGEPQCQCTLFSYDQSIQVYCDDIVYRQGKMIPAQQGTVILKRLQTNYEINFVDFRKSNKIELSLNNVTEYATECAKFVLNELNKDSCAILFMNMDDSHQRATLYSMLIKQEKIMETKQEKTVTIAPIVTSFEKQQISLYQKVKNVIYEYMILFVQINMIILTMKIFVM
jgi:hypothetical protein